MARETLRHMDELVGAIRDFLAGCALLSGSASGVWMRLAPAAGEVRWIARDPLPKVEPGSCWSRAGIRP